MVDVLYADEARDGSEIAERERSKFSLFDSVEKFNESEKVR